MSDEDIKEREADRERLRNMLLDGFNSELSPRLWDKEYFENLRRRIRAHADQLSEPKVESVKMDCDSR